MTKGSLWKKCTPSVDRHWLMLLGGLLWSGVGISLCITACYWFSHLAWPMSILGILSGFGSGILFYRFGFSRIALKNIDRISQQPRTVCLFAFQAWRSYFLIIFMMLLGYILRHTLIPKVITAAIYAAIGTGLTLSSTLYYTHSTK